MKCPQCESTGMRSQVFPGPRYTTLMSSHSYYDEDGRLHHHDPNVSTTQYKCSNGHEWPEHSAPTCSVPGCDFIA